MKAKSKTRMLPSSLKIISSCIKSVSTNASTVVRSAGASIVASVAAAAAASSSHGTKDQVTWSGFDSLVLSPLISKRVLLLGYQNGFQVYDLQDAANFTELVSKKDCGFVSSMQIIPVPYGGPGSSHPLLLVVAREEVVSNSSNESTHLQGNQSEKNDNSPTAVKFYSLKTNCFVQDLRFRSVVCMVRCSSKIVAIALPTQIYCIDAVSLVNKFSVLTYPVPQFGGRGKIGVNVGYGPMAVGTRWLAYASENPIITSKSRLSPKNLNPSQIVNQSSLGSSNNLVAHYAKESSKHIAAGLINMGDKGYRTVSRYCQELLQDGLSSPTPSTSGWKFGRNVPPIAENSGMVVVKDFVSQEVISQFSAHTSPISALCFDPSGTLLVTASVNGTNINIFYITPTYTRSDSRERTYDWSSAHVHLYKLYRGMTSAIIQDICFNHCSQWISIISSKGTCHIFTLSPFGGEIGLQTSDCHSESPISYPILSSPWWSTSTFSINPQLTSPPATVTLSVVCRIKDCVSGVINSVSNAASLAGNGYIPSGATTAIFHNAIAAGVGNSQSESNMLEHLLVYSPSGHLVQYGLMHVVGVQSSNGRSLLHSNSRVHAQDNNLEVKVEPIELWDVCRKSDSIERDASLEFPIVSKQEAGFEVRENNCAQFNSNIVGKKLLRDNTLDAHEKSHLYLCNAEVQINSGRLPIWQNRKVSFQRMVSPKINTHAEGESEIEKIQLHGVETKRKDLLSVFDNPQCIGNEGIEVC
ncbi:autophagy-related protein 18g-like isoform X2 [Impatiens glandulifera]|uniref:autophagy-related protein 18g-like isoform X2 n=1 Tax=Impatiens glandulifera TaxID=253017 RepID=UPI001FB17AD1|nr:autophagy-related protein 18g-like isoform X2 [Impatiens glandulifera]